MTELATVISSPSRIHATPSATTMRVWNRDHGSRSIRAGMRLRTTPGAGADVVTRVTTRLFASLIVQSGDFQRRSEAQLGGPTH